MRLGLAATVRENQQIDARGPICIVDDDAWVCDSLSVLLETYGFAVLTYTSGAEFLEGYPAPRSEVPDYRSAHARVGRA